MKNILLALLSLALGISQAAPPTEGQFLFQRKPASGPFQQFGVTPASGQAFGWNGTSVVMLPVEDSGGTVTGVGVAFPGMFNVTGSPVTTSGVITATLATQGAGKFFSGPASGADAAPTFRDIVADDLPAAVLLDTGSYSNPTWLTSLAWSKITSPPTTLSGYGITDPIVLSSGSYANPSWVTSLAWTKITSTPTTLSGYGITDPIALTSGSYSNPSWISSLAWSKITSTPTTLSGYGITDPIVLTSGSYSNPAWITTLDWSKITGEPTFLTDVDWGDIGGTLASQTDLNAALSGKEPTITAGTSAQYWRGDKSWQSLNSTAVGLGNVENTALSTWAGSANITTLGTISSGTVPVARVSGLAASATTDTTNASNITSGTLPATQLPVAGTTTIGGVKRNAGAAGQFIYGYDTSGNALYSTPVEGYRPNANALINGGFSVAQRGTTFTSIADDTYCLDRWVALHDGASLTVSQANHTSVGDPPFSLRFVCGSASLSFGVAQIIAHEGMRDMIGSDVTLSFRVKGTAVSQSIRAVVLSWTGTADTVTSDIVTTWNGFGVLPTFAANYTVEGSTPVTSTNSSWQDVELTVNVSTSTAKNLVVFIYGEPMGGALRICEISDVQLEPGSVRTPFQRRLISQETNDCQRYYEIVRYNSSNQAALSSVYSGTQGVHYWYFKAVKRTTPTASLVTGSWTGGTPTFVPNADCCYLTRVAGPFLASGTSGNIALAADAEL